MLTKTAGKMSACFTVFSLVLSWCLFLGASSLCAQEKVQRPTRNITAATAQAPPKIDGLLDDPVWQAAEWQDNLVQYRPTPGDIPQAATRVAVACDRQFIYAAFRCLNPGGAATNSSIAERDGDMDNDNAITLYLDTFHTRRDCYYFSTNSLGTQVDGRISEDGLSNDKKWDCTWWVASHEDSLGWSCEMKIPVSEIRIPRGEGRLWGINFRRNYPQMFETSFWQYRDVAWRVSQSGDLLGLPAFSKLLSATLYPYLVGLDSNQPASGRRTILSSGGRELVGGADLRLKLGNTMDGNITCNPDFATVEADLSKINLTRYEISYPEKRLYFLEGAELFNNEINVFYSRRIGDLNWGVKTNGRVGKVNYAVLTADERAGVGGNPSAQTGAVRLQRDILGSSNIGLTAVSRAWDGGYARVLSGDGVLVFNSNTSIRTQLVGSFPSGGDKFASAAALRFSYARGLYQVNAGGYHYDSGFQKNVNRVALVPQDNYNRPFTWFSGEHWIRRHGIDKISFNQGNDLAWHNNGDLQLVKIRSTEGVTFLSNWQVDFGGVYQTELFEKRFHNPSWTTDIIWNDRISKSARLTRTWGRNFERDFNQTSLTGAFKPVSGLSLSSSLTVLRFSPDSTNQETSLFDLTADYNFSPDFWFHLTGEYNSNNDRVYFYGLFGWRFRPPFGALYVAYTADRFDMPDSRLGRTLGRRDRALFVKLTVPLTIY